MHQDLCVLPVFELLQAQTPEGRLHGGGGLRLTFSQWQWPWQLCTDIDSKGLGQGTPSDPA